jgi:predicted transcriptional regulator
LFSVLRNLKGSFAVSMKKNKASRSLASNRYYWGVVLAYLSEETGFTKDESHQLMQKMFLKYTKDAPDGTSELFVRSTTSLNTAEMNDYIEQIRIFAVSELGCYIPEPNEIVYEK